MNLHKWNKTLLFSLLLVGLAICAPGSPSRPDIHSLYFEVISTQDKLPNSVIRCIDQDSIGFLWFGSNDGLFRYDGQNYQIFRNVPNDPASLSFNYVVDMHLDREGNPWVLNYTSLDKLNTRNGTFRHYHPLSQDEPTDLGAVYQIAISPKENAYITYVRHGLLIKANNDSVIHIGPPSVMQGNIRIKAFSETKRNIQSFV
ncbi:MAG: two-component regulator propeller domain-containing protein [Mangrovibacterium sp.]